MIYAIQDGKKVPLGSQFDNSWQIEYDRDLSSQLANQKEWTAPEDCWFQYHSIFYSQPNTTKSSDNVTLTIQLNGIVVANTDNILDSDGGTLYEITASVLMKKGDVISYKNTVDNIQAPPFTAKCGKIFPIHRILSKDEGLTDTRIRTSLGDGTYVERTVTLYPTRNDLYTFDISYEFSPRSWNQPYQIFSHSITGFDFININTSFTQANVGPILASDLSNDNSYAVITNSSQIVTLHISGIVRRKS